MKTISKVSLDVLYKKVALKKEIGIKKSMLTKCVKSALTHANFTHNNQVINICLMLTYAQDMKQLNQKFCNKNYATNTLAFPDIELDKPSNINLIKNVANLYLGDIAMCVDIIKKESKILNIPVEARFYHLFSHSTLHLLGIHHDTPEQTIKMKTIEKKIIKEIGYCAQECVENGYTI